MLIKRIAIFLCGLVVSVSSFAGGEAMFGLQWGMTTSQVRASGVTMTKASSEKHIETYKASSMPKNVAEVESYTLVFSDDKLVKMGMVTKNITDDPSGREGKEKFESLLAALKEKYGAPSDTYQQTGIKLFKEYDEFYQCLRYSGCGMWAAFFKTPNKHLALELKGMSRGKGWIALTSEAQPEWDQALEKLKTANNTSTKDAL